MIDPRNNHPKISFTLETRRHFIGCRLDPVTAVKYTRWGIGLPRI